MSEWVSSIHQQVINVREKGTLMHCCWECRLVQPLWKAVWSYLKKLKNGTASWPSNSISGIYLKKPETLTWKNICTPLSIAVLLAIANIWKQPNPSVDEWIKKLWYICAMEFYLTVKRRKSNLLYGPYRIYEPGEYYTKWDKPVRERQVSYDLAYMWNLMNKTNKETK